MVYETLDLFNLFVENIFGNLLFAIIGLTIVYAIICMMARMSLILTSTIIILFLVTMLVGTFGSIVGVMIFAFSFIYFIMSIIPWIRGWIG